MEYERLTAGGVRWWATPRFAPLVRSGEFADFPSLCARARVLKDLRMKRTLEVGGWIIRIHKPGSVWKRLSTVVRGSRARRELERSRAVVAAGVPTVPVEAAAEWKGGSACVFEKLDGWTSLELVLRNGRDDAMLRRYGAFARRAHDAGVLQDDFNPSNVLVKGDEMRIIDFERLEVRPSLSEAQRLRLVAKLLRLATVGRAGIEAYLDGYVKAGESRDAVRDRVLALAERQSRIDRERLAKNCLKENRNFGRVERTHYRKGYEGRDGVSAFEACALAGRPAGYSYRDAEDAVRAWQEANVASADGGPVPLAVVVAGRGKRGFLVFRAS
jgi:tRNA A-37 threonylcarbamoyl transferase component Bud32